MKPYYEHAGITIYHGDCREILPSLEPVDLLLTDPPYGIAQGSAVVRRNCKDIEDWGDAIHNAEVVGWRSLVRLTENAWVVEFGAMAANDFLTKPHKSAGWMPSNVYAIVKQAPPPTPRPGFVSAIELAVVSRIGKPKWNGGGFTPNRWIGLTPNRDGSDLGHPTQKPHEPISALILALSSEDDCVLDPFMGSGTTLRAAKDLGRKAIGIEIEEKYCEIAAKRMSQEVFQFA